MPDILVNMSASTSDLITRTRTSTQVQVFYFDSNTFVPL